MKVILFEIGNFPIRSYGLIVALAVLLATGVAYYLAKNTKYQKHILDMMVYVIIGSIIGARFWHVFFFQWDYYSSNVSQLFAVWNGGLAIQGGLVGGFITGALYAWKNKLNFWELADTIAPAIILGQAIGRIACLLNGDAYGSPTGSSFGLVYPEGTMAYSAYGSEPLWPAEVWEGQWGFIVFGLLLIMKNKTWPTGFIFLTYNILYSVGRFSLGFLRGDSPRYLFDLTAGQLTSLSVIAISIVLMVFFYIKSKKFVAVQRVSKK
jgi:phosphatidylglycerol:prolipoprotein diacylglycerol transferase